MIDNARLEQCVLAILIVNPHTISISGLENEDFWESYSRNIFKSIIDVSNAGGVVTFATVHLQMEKNNIAGAKGVTKLLEGIDPGDISVNLLTGYIKELKELRARRDLKVSIEGKGDIGDMFDKVKKIEMRLTETNTQDLEEAYDEYMIEYAQRKNNKIGIDTGYHTLDELAPMEAGTMSILAARSSIGKSAFALNIAFNAADKGHNVLFVSAEMSIPRLLDRLFALMTDVEAWKFRKSKADSSMENLKQIVKDLKLKLKFIYVPYATSGEICRIIKKENLRDKKDLVIVDYLQYLRDKKTSGENEATRVANITRNFKGVAGECKLATLVLSQVNRASAQEEDGRPKIHQLRDSGAIEQDADVVMMLNRVDKESHYATLDIAKNRNGQSDVTVEFDFNPRTTRFLEKPEQKLPTGYKETFF